MWKSETGDQVTGDVGEGGRQQRLTHGCGSGNREKWADLGHILDAKLMALLPVWNVMGKEKYFGWQACGANMKRKRLEIGDGE